MMDLLFPQNSNFLKTFDKQHVAFCLGDCLKLIPANHREIDRRSSTAIYTEGKKFSNILLGFTV